MSEIYLRKAVLEDAELLFAWANDMDVRRNAFSQKEIEWDEHMAWFHKKLEAPDCMIYIACEKPTSVSEDDEELIEEIAELGKPELFGITKKQMSTENPVGQIRLDLEDGVAEIDYSIASEKRGRGLGSKMLELAMKRAPFEIKEYYAQVKRNNKASARVFEKCGFEKTAENESCYEYKKCVSVEGIRKKSIVICTQKSWNIAFAEQMKKDYDDIYDISVITEKEQLTPETLEKLNPEYVFVPHWSYIIPEAVWGKFTCVVFHMTDLPFGRGGSPLQNLIVRGFTHTKISAIRVEEGLDTGDIYMKQELELSGTAEEILQRASDIIFHKMIPYILENNPEPVPQSGESVAFKRRKPEDGRLLPDMDLKTIYDYIRMLDGEGYPNAFLELGDIKLKFSKASLEEGRVVAQVVFEKEK